jgi:D-glycero-D-manno-heptose 1,7-bisphosphate phosphatase
MTPAVFLDLSGTLVMPIQVNHPSELVEIPGAADAIRRLTRAGYVCPVVTIQSRIEKGLFSAQAFQIWFESLRVRWSGIGAELAGPYVCPHLFSTACPCKKPSPLLYTQAAADHGIDLGTSYVIGDTAADVEAAARFGGRGILVRTGYGASHEAMAAAAPHAAFIGRDLSECVGWILRPSSP